MEANAFLRHMMRRIVGTLVEVGLGRLPPPGMASILAAGRQTQRTPAAPARGLCLWRVHYAGLPDRERGRRRRDGTGHAGGRATRQGRNVTGWTMAMKTYTPKGEELQHRWWVVDAEGQILGRLASAWSPPGCGARTSPTFAPHMNGGDFVVVVNAEKVRVTGRKLEQKVYTRHSGYPGGFREITLGDQLEKHPERVIEAAVRGMLPRNTLGHHLMTQLKVYAGPDHPHAAQKPETWALATAETGGSEA